MNLMGGPIAGTTQPDTVSDQILRLMAHGKLQRACQRYDLHSHVLRVCAHHGWEVEDSYETNEVHFDATGLPDVSLDEDTRFQNKTSEEQWEWVLQYIETHGVDGFFADCYGLANRDEQDLSSENMLVDAFYLLSYIDRMPRQEEGCALVEQLMILSEPKWKIEALKLNARRRCLTAAEQIKMDECTRMGSDEESKHNQRIPPDPYIRLSLGKKMMITDQCAKLLGIPSMVEKCELPERILDIVNRDFMDKEQCDEERPKGDHKVLKCLQRIAEKLKIKKPGNTAKSLIDTIAQRCGMRVYYGKQREWTRPEKYGMRVHQYPRMELVRTMPYFVDDWLVYSKRLGRKVRTSEWADAHLPLELESLESLSEDELPAEMLDPLESFADRSRRVEMLDADVIANELERLRGMNDLDKESKSWLAWLENADETAIKSSTDPSVWRLVVTYTQLKCGRRQASRPSLQDCPNGLRRKVAKRFYHGIDIKNCKPTVFLKWALDENVCGLAMLRRLVEHRSDILKEIAEFYGVHPSKCKKVILTVLSGGDEKEWIQEAGCTRNTRQTAPELEELKDCHRSLRDMMFKKHKKRVEPLQQELKKRADANVEQTLAAAKAAVSSRQRQETRAAWEKARQKALTSAIDRSVFSFLYFEVEDKILDEMDRCFKENGWSVDSLIFDEVLVQDREGIDIDEAMRHTSGAGGASESGLPHRIGGGGPLRSERVLLVTDIFLFTEGKGAWQKLSLVRRIWCISYCSTRSFVPRPLSLQAASAKPGEVCA